MHPRTILVGVFVFLALAAAAILLGIVSARADTAFTVDDTTDALDTNPGDGACATVGGTCTLRAAIMETNALTGEDTVVLPSGVYTLTIGGSGEDMATLGDLDITDDLTIVGAGAQSTIIDGNGSVIIDRVMDVVGSGVKVVITDATIRNGGYTSYGAGGIKVDGKLALSNSAIGDNVGTGVSVARTGILTMTNCTISKNTFLGIGCEGGRLMLTNCSIHSNGSNGIVNVGGELVVTKSTIRDNARSGIGNVEQGELLLEDSTVSGNTQPFGLDRGGGITNLGSTAMVIRSTIRDNTTAYDGGGIFSSGSLTVISSTICSNMAVGCGGIRTDGKAIVTSSTVSSNIAAYGAGGICSSDTLHLTNTTISGNQTNEHGGGIYIRDSINLNNVTITGNIADADNDGSGDGGGIYANPDNAVRAANSIIAGNTDNSPQTKHPDCSGTLISEGYNLIQDTTGCFIGGNTTGHLTGVDPLLDALNDNGGPTFTQALLPGSPAINAGNPAGCTDHLGSPLLTDQRGKPRVGRCDMGAYEQTALHFSTKTASAPAALPGAPMTYTITIKNGEPVDIPSVLVTDTLPAFVTYVDDSLTATAGDHGYEDGLVTWTGSVNAVGTVVIAFRATLSDTVPLGTSIENTALISSARQVISRTATVYVGHQIHLPIVMKGGG